MGQLNAPIFDIDRADLEVTVTKYVPGTGLAWPVLFPLKYTRRFDLKGLEGNEGIAVSADRVAFNTKAPLKTREKVGSWNGKLAKISVSREMDEEDINDYNDLKVLAASNQSPEDAQELIDMTYNDVDFCNRAMDIKVEIDALGIGCSGKKTFTTKIDGENATTDEINFNVPEDNYRGAAAKWDDKEHADGLKDINDAQDMIAKKGFPKPMFAIMEKAAFENLCAQKATANRLYPQAKSLAMITGDMISIDAINAYQRKSNHPQIVVLETYARVENKAGEFDVIKPWNENVVTMAPTVQLGWTYWKPVPEVKNVGALQVRGNYYKMTCYSEVNPMVEGTMAEGYIQSALINRRSTVFLNANATSWNGGQE